MMQVEIREGARRQHRTIGLFCVVQCWLRGLDGVVLRRGDLERLLGLRRFKGSRLAWLEVDLDEFFHYRKLRTTTTASYSESLVSLTISRVPLDESPKVEEFQIWPRPSASNLSVLYAGVKPLFDEYANSDERLVSAYLALLCQGQISAHSILPLTEDDTNG